MIPLCLKGFPGLPPGAAGPWHIRCSTGPGMKCIGSTETEMTAPPVACEVRLPMGLLGFEQIKEYLLVSDPAEEPFRWLRVKGDPSLAFAVVEPFIAVPDYQPDIPQPDVDFLSLSQTDEALVYSIVTLHAGQRATINLKGPIVINRSTGIGKQVIIANAANYSVQHPLPEAEAAA
jgi:flagellar assembly factor FliW